MPTMFLIKGQGTLTQDDKTTTYPIFRLVLANSKNGNTVEVKMDKFSKKLLPALFNITPTGEMYEDDNGVQCQVFELQDESSK